MNCHGFCDNFMISNENHDILCLQPSATLHETLISLRKKQGLSSLALQGAHKTENSVKFQKLHQNSPNFMKFHEISIKFMKTQIFKENHVFLCPGVILSSATLEKA